MLGVVLACRFTRRFIAGTQQNTTLIGKHDLGWRLKCSLKSKFFFKNFTSPNLIKKIDMTNTKLIAFLALTLVSFTNVYATLTDDDYFDTKPDDKPIWQTDNNFATAKYWSCKGTVDPELQAVLLKNLTTLSNNTKVQAPTEVCTFKVLNIKNQNRTVYEVEFHLSQAALKKCLVDDVCDETRSVSLPMIKGKLHQSYFLRSISKGVIAEACVAMNGSVISGTDACK